MSQAVLGHLGVLLLFAHDAHVVCETVRCRCKLHCRMQCKAERLKGVGWRRNGLGSKDLVERNRLSGIENFGRRRIERKEQQKHPSRPRVSACSGYDVIQHIQVQATFGEFFGSFGYVFEASAAFERWDYSEAED